MQILPSSSHNNLDSSAGRPQQQQPPQPKEELLLEIRRLRERIRTLEGDNATMHLKLSRTQRDVEERLAEIEHQIGPDDHRGDVGGNAEDEEDGTSASNASCSLASGLDGDEREEEEEKNRESFI